MVSRAQDRKEPPGHAPPEPGEDANLVPCRRLAAAVTAQAYKDLEGRDWRGAYRFLTGTLWEPGCLWGELLAHVLVEHNVRARARVVAERRWKEDPRADPLD